MQEIANVNKEAETLREGLLMELAKDELANEDGAKNKTLAEDFASVCPHPVVKCAMQMLLCCHQWMSQSSLQHIFCRQWLPE